MKQAISSASTLNGAQEPARRPVKHRTIAGTVAEDLRRRIISGEIPPGTQLRQDALAREFDVSRIPIREALMQLDAEGLVRITPHRGAHVPDLEMGDINEVFDLRALLEPRLLLSSAPHLTRDDFATLRKTLEEYSSELRATHIERWGEINIAFHLMLYSRANQPRTLAIVTKLLQESERHSRLQLSLTRGLERAEAEHAMLVELCADGNVAAAIDLLRAHIENVGKSLATYVKEHPIKNEG